MSEPYIDQLCSSKYFVNKFISDKSSVAKKKTSDNAG